MRLADKWFKDKGWKPHKFQRQAWNAIADGKSGLLNAPTGYGKTFALWFGIIQHFADHERKGTNNLHCLYISPLRALSKEIYNATNTVSEDLGLKYKVELRTGDTTGKDRTLQLKQKHQALITTPESMHLMLAAKGYAEKLNNLQFVVIDEWHELLGNKRGVQVQLALSKLKALNPGLCIWGISATIGNLDEAKDILLGKDYDDGIIIRAEIKKKIIVNTILPDEIEKFPWGGHLGIKLLPKIIPLIKESSSVLIFTNTRSQAEIWYQQLLNNAPELAGLIAIHHGSLDNTVRKWVEENLHKGNLKAVICTSSLDLGVDFRPVDTIVQVSSAKGVARFMQRAGRSGHSPGETSTIYFVPANSLEIIEGTALRHAIKNQLIESRIPHIRSFDVLIQYMITLAVSDGFLPEQLYREVLSTHCFASITVDEWQWCLDFITKGGQTLANYEEYHKVVIVDGIYKVTSKGVAMRHRLSIGTIVSDTMMSVQFLGGKRLGVIEETFISKLKPGSVFWFSGKNLELYAIKDMTVLVKKAKTKNGLVPSWLGGRMPLSSELSFSIRKRLDDYINNRDMDDELKKMKPLFELQKRYSHLPGNNELLIEKIKINRNYHLFVYPLDGRLVHEGMAVLLAYRIGLLRTISFSVAVNDYGFELMSDQDMDVEEILNNNLFTPDNIYQDAVDSMNSSLMAQRKFRDIATIAGLVFTGYPGKRARTRHLQASSRLFFDVFNDYDKHNLLLLQAYDEVFNFQLEIARQQAAFRRISQQEIVVTYPRKPTPFCFPILAEMFKESHSNEPLEKRMEKILSSIEKDAN
jgi:ATP-dependent helicase Lhr and Lhr-like helicase